MESMIYSQRVMIIVKKKDIQSEKKVFRQKGKMIIKEVIMSKRKGYYKKGSYTPEARYIGIKEGIKKR